jgi:glycosyltransferase involved in cell wall biosynthesis
LERSLTVLLPVRNAQATLSANVSHILEVVSDISPQFEVLIVDDGSSDATGEVAADLARCYPQVRALHHRRPLGREAAVRTGVKASRGELIVLEEHNTATALAEIRDQWRQTAASLSRNVQTLPHPSTDRRTAPANDFPAGFDVLPRRTLDKPAGGRPNRPNFLARVKNFALGE